VVFRLGAWRVIQHLRAENQSVIEARMSEIVAVVFGAAAIFFRCMFLRAVIFLQQPHGGDIGCSVSGGFGWRVCLCVRGVCCERPVGPFTVSSRARAQTKNLQRQWATRSREAVR